jgi:hypothetical protein
MMTFFLCGYFYGAAFALWAMGAQWWYVVFHFVMAALLSGVPLLRAFEAIERFFERRNRGKIGE